MTQTAVAKCFMVGGIMLIISTFTSLISTINNYDTYVSDNASQVVAAFDG